MKTSSLNVILILIAAVIFVFIAVVIYNNRDGEQIVNISLKSILIPVIIGLGLLLVEFTKPVDSFEKEIHIGLCEDPLIMMNLDNRTSFDLSIGLQNYAILLAELKREDSVSILLPDEVDSFLQVQVLDILSKRFSTHWYSEYRKEDWFFESGSSVISSKEGAEKVPLKVFFKELKCQSDNKFLKRINGEAFFYLPSSGKITLGNKHEDFIRIETDNIDLSIKLISVDNQPLTLSATKTAEYYRNKLGVPVRETNRIGFYGKTLHFEAKPKRIRRWSPDTTKEMEWVKDFESYLNATISWEEFRKNT